MPLQTPAQGLDHDTFLLERAFFEDEAKCEWETELHSPFGPGCLVRPVVLFVITCRNDRRLSCADIYAQWIAMNRPNPLLGNRPPLIILTCKFCDRPAGTCWKVVPV